MSAIINAIAARLANGGRVRAARLATAVASIKESDTSSSSRKVTAESAKALPGETKQDKADAALLGASRLVADCCDGKSLVALLEEAFKAGAESAKAPAIAPAKKAA